MSGPEKWAVEDMLRIDGWRPGVTADNYRDMMMAKDVRVVHERAIRLTAIIAAHAPKDVDVEKYDPKSICGFDIQCERCGGWSQCDCLAVAGGIVIKKGEDDE